MFPPMQVPCKIHLPVCYFATVLLYFYTFFIIQVYWGCGQHGVIGRHVMCHVEGEYKGEGDSVRTGLSASDWPHNQQPVILRYALE